MKTDYAMDLHMHSSFSDDGEIAPEMYARGDLVPYANGVKELLVVVPEPLRVQV